MRAMAKSRTGTWGRGRGLALFNDNEPFFSTNPRFRFAHKMQYLATDVFLFCFEREFFYPKAGRVKVENFLTIINAGGEDNFFRSYSAQFNTNQLEALLAELEGSVEIPDVGDIPRAVYVVGKNSNPQSNTVIWAT